MAKKRKQKKWKAVSIDIDKRTVETMSPGILVAVAEWRWQ